MQSRRDFLATTLAAGAVALGPGAWSTQRVPKRILILGGPVLCSGTRPISTSSSPRAVYVDRGRLPYGHAEGLRQEGGALRSCHRGASRIINGPG